MAAEAFIIDAADSVATALGELQPGEVALLGETNEASLAVIENIRAGHKFALNAIKPGEPVVKYGVVIGEATQPIKPGAWVHLHNLASRYDEASSDLDLESGAPPEQNHYA